MSDSQKPLDPARPDLDESINISATQARILREAAAAAREKRVSENGLQPAPIGLLVVCLVVALFAGGAYFAGGSNLFNYKETFRSGYVRAKAPGGDDSGPKPKPALDAYMAKGAKVYSSKCQGCHGADAKGDGASYPSLAGSAWVTGPNERFSQIVLNGLQGPTSSGKTFGAGLMPAQGAGMTPEELAGLLTYVRNNFGNKTGDVVTVEMAKAAMDISSKRAKAGQPVSGAELDAEHKKDLPGAKIDPTSLVHPTKFTPAAAK